MVGYFIFPTRSLWGSLHQLSGYLPTYIPLFLAEEKNSHRFKTTYRRV